MLMGRESMMTRADQQAKYMLFCGKAFDLDSLILTIDEVDMAAIRRVADKIFVSRPTLAALGPLDKLEEFSSIEQRLMLKKNAA
jgi:predicted Zn-dependent peptidase